MPARGQKNNTVGLRRLLYLKPRILRIILKIGLKQGLEKTTEIYLQQKHNLHKNN